METKFSPLSYIRHFHRGFDMKETDRLSELLVWVAVVLMFISISIPIPRIG